MNPRVKKSISKKKRWGEHAAPSTRSLNAPVGRAKRLEGGSSVGRIRDFVGTPLGGVCGAKHREGKSTVQGLAPKLRTRGGKITNCIGGGLLGWDFVGEGFLLTNQ